MPTPLILFLVHKKSPYLIRVRGISNNELAMTYSHMGNPTLPSALRGFTSEFGKGSGGSLLLLSPAQLLWILTEVFSQSSALRALAFNQIEYINRLFELHFMF